MPITLSNKGAANRRLITGFLALLLAGLLGVGGFLVSNFAPKEGTHITKNVKGGYTMTVDGKPFIVKGVCYSPVGPGKAYLYNWWGDPGKPWMVDGKLMQEAGINTVRIYEPGGNPTQVKQVISDLYNNFGIRTILGHTLGFYDSPKPNYADPDFQQTMKRQVYEMFKTYSGEPGILCWVIGNEANYSFDDKTNINPWSTPELEAISDPAEKKLAKAKIYYSFMNELAQIAKKMDPARPVGFGNGKLRSIDIAKEYAPDFDFVGIIIYRGKSFGNLFRQLKQEYGKPGMVIEFGCDSFNAKTQQPDEEMQAFFLTTLWKELVGNTYEGTGENNCFGGCIFEWNDEWWKHEQSDPKGWDTHDTGAGWGNGSYYFDGDAEGGLNMNEEWWGIVSISAETENGVNIRVPKKAYYALSELWKSE